MAYDANKNTIFFQRCQNMAVNARFSRRDFTGRRFLNVDPAKFSDSTIVGTCFAHERPDTDVFPVGVSNIVFAKCNLDNVIIPATCTVLRTCSIRRHETQNDGYPWVVDGGGSPVEPLHIKLFLDNGWSIDPLSIPTTKVLTSTMLKKRYLEITDAEWAASAPDGSDPPRHPALWYKEKPTVDFEETRTGRIESRVWTGVEEFRFDAVPTLIRTVVRFHPDPATGDPIPTTFYILEGSVTRVTVSGASWR